MLTLWKPRTDHDLDRINQIDNADRIYSTDHIDHTDHIDYLDRIDHIIGNIYRTPYRIYMINWCIPSKTVRFIPLKDLYAPGTDLVAPPVPPPPPPQLPLLQTQAPTPLKTPPFPHRLYDLQDTLDKLMHFLP